LEAFRHAKANNLKVMPLGLGTNIIIPDTLNRLVVKNNLKGVTEEKNTLKVSSGENWHDLVIWTVKKGLFGLENLALIPGTVGAGPIQNIGAYGREISEFIVSVDVFDLDSLEKLTLNNNECNFKYRDSIFKKANKYFITSVNLRLNHIDRPRTQYKRLSEYLIQNNIDPMKTTANQVIDSVITLRTELLPDPNIIPNAGSFFKNIYVNDTELKRLRKIDHKMPSFYEKDNSHKIPVAYILEKEGWKGKKEGCIGISKQHALIVTTEEGSTYKDLINFSKKIQQSIFIKYKIKLEIEPVEFR